MNILDQLTDLRRSTPGCILMALSDMNSGIVLCSDAVIPLPQERLDTLAKTAQRVFSDPDLHTILPDGDLDEVVMLNQSNAQVFLRAGPDEGEVLCCVCAAEADLQPLREGARTLLQGLMAPA